MTTRTRLALPHALVNEVGPELRKERPWPLPRRIGCSCSPLITRWASSFGGRKPFLYRQRQKGEVDVARRVPPVVQAAQGALRPRDVPAGRGERGLGRLDGYGRVELSGPGRRRGWKVWVVGSAGTGFSRRACARAPGALVRQAPRSPFLQQADIRSIDPSSSNSAAAMAAERFAPTSL